MENFGWLYGFFICAAIVLFDVIIPYNIILYLTEHPRFARTNPLRLQVMIFLGIVITTVVINGLMNFIINDSTRYLKYSAVWSFYISGFGSLIYLFFRQYELEKKRKLFEKELELLRLKELKTKAELDALHSKVNPHFLYNALNSIADLTITDAKKARQMTLALADFLRYSINYNDSNYSTVKEELETAELYLQIEKTRFEDSLIYKTEADENSLFYLVPKFILQPLVENAVKHGLKQIDKITEINLQIFIQQQTLVIRIYDNGHPFPAEIIPGYGLKSVYDKLELLFPGKFEINMINEPVKFLEISIINPIKNEPTP